MERPHSPRGWRRALQTERYFEATYGQLADFRGRSLVNTTAFGCGYDFRLHPEAHPEEFVAVEVKGLTGQTGSVAMTPKEYDAANSLGERFFLFVVRNFRELPMHTIFKDPVHSVLQFRRTERLITQVSWLTAV